jgi:acyl carrier protein
MSGATSTTTVTPAAVEATISDALRRFGVDATDITREATFAGLDVDSLDLAEVAQIIDERYGIELKSEDLKAIRTIGDAIDLVVSRAA